MHAHHQEGCNDLCECKALCSIYDLQSPESAGSIINSLASGGFDYSLQLVNFKLISTRVGFLPEEMYFFQDARKKLENSYFFQFLPEETGWNGRNWKKLKYPKMLKICLVSNITSTYISVIIKDGINLFTDSTFRFPHQPNVKDAAISELWV